MPTKTLTIVGGWRDKGARVFNAQNPNVALLFADRGYGSSTGLGQAMITGDTSIDVVNYSYSNNFDVLMKKGFWRRPFRQREADEFREEHVPRHAERRDAGRQAVRHSHQHVGRGMELFEGDAGKCGG